MKSSKLLGIFQSERLKQARLFAGLSTTELAERAGVSRQIIHSYENPISAKTPSAETVKSLCNVLGVPENFLMRGLRAEESIESAITFRSLQRNRQFERNSAGAALQLLSSLSAHISEDVELPPVTLPEFDIPSIELITNDFIEDIAIRCRQEMGLGLGPIPNLTLLLENHGVIVGNWQLADGMDGLCAWFGNRPHILITSSAYHARARMDLAHELGHLILHREVSQEQIDDVVQLRLIEKQAKRFASAFLLPERSFLPEVYTVDFSHLVEIKRRWGVSVAAMIYRLHQLNVISTEKHTRLQQSLTARGWKRKEPLDLDTPAESPIFLNRAADFVAQSGLQHKAEIFLNSGLPKNFLLQAAGLTEVDLVQQQMPNNVVQFRRKT